MKHILIIEDEIDICKLLQEYLAQHDISSLCAYSGTSGLELLEKGSYDLLLCDFRLGDMDGIELLDRINRLKPGIPVIFITGYADIKMAVQIIKMGAYDYITKPIYPDEILLSIKEALRAADEHDHKTKEPIHKLIGESRQIKHILEQIELVAPTNYRVILNGESGTGKESVAQIIHYKSKRYKKPFVALDCGALSRDLAASELFGHERGSFTGAIGSKEGHFEMANGGTLFLDEISNLPYDVQVSLLRVLQEKSLRRVGGRKDIPLDVRIIVASNENLEKAVERGAFRSDLYHRLNEFSITIPPLRERAADIMVLAEFFLKRTAGELGKNIRFFSDEVKEVFSSYAWPGNVRELQNVIRKAGLVAMGDTVMLHDVPVEIVNSVKARIVAEKMHQQQDLKKQPDLKQIAHEAEIKLILEVLKQVNFNRTKAAEILKIDRKTLYNKLKDLEI
jgi:two-component system response regulator HydG